MPTYSYACKSCDHAFDIRQSFTDDALTKCPKCGQPTLRKVLHPVGITFKGSGFYRNDSKASAASGGKKESNGSSAGSESTSTPASASPSEKASSGTNGSASSESGAASSGAAAASSTPS